MHVAKPRGMCRFRLWYAAGVYLLQNLHHIKNLPRTLLAVLRQRGFWLWNIESLNASNPYSCPFFCFSGLMEIRSVSVGVVAIKSVNTGLYLAMSKKGTLFGSVRIQPYDIAFGGQDFLVIRSSHWGGWKRYPRWIAWKHFTRKPRKRPKCHTSIPAPRLTIPASSTSLLHCQNRW